MDTRRLGELIREARQRRGWTQADLASRLGVEKSYVSAIETGMRKWPQEYVRALGRELGLSQVEMAVAAGLIDPPDEAPPSPPDPVVAELVEALAGATPEQVRALTEAVRVLLRR